MFNMDHHVVREERAFSVNSDILVDYTYDEVIESLRPGGSWMLESMQRCCEDHLTLVFFKEND